MTAYYGHDAIDYLASKIKQVDPKSSSHWNHFHSKFDYHDGKFSGVEGFGSNRQVFSGLRGLAHNIFQIPFRAMGKKFSNFEKIDRVAKGILSKQDKGYSLDVLRQVITLAYLEDKKVVKNNATSCVIGDGYGTMTCLLFENNHQRIISVNLSKTLLMDLWQIKLFLGDKFEEVVLVTEKHDIPETLLKTNNKPSIIAIEAENHNLIRLFPLDLSINIASMQEMNPEIVEEYFEDISIATLRGGAFYCCNREEKILPDGTKSIFSNYPWHLSRESLEDDLCPWHLKYYNLKVPFYHSYDGPARHRLVKF